LVGVKRLTTKREHLPDIIKQLVDEWDHIKIQPSQLGSEFVDIKCWRRRLPDDIEDQVIKLYKDGVKTNEISEKLGIPLKQLYEILHKHGIPLRTET